VAAPSKFPQIPLNNLVNNCEGGKIYDRTRKGGI
jgi:hypothetical protein